MKKKIKLMSAMLILMITLVGCTQTQSGTTTNTVAPTITGSSTVTDSTTVINPTTGTTSDASTGTTDSYTESIDDTSSYDGYFEEEIVDIEVTYVSGTKNCYTLEGNTLTFTTISEKTVYAVSGKLNGNIIIDVGDDYKFDLEMQGLTIVSEEINPITVLSGDEVSIKATKDYENYIYDTREAISEDDSTLFSGAIHSEVDLEIAGKGKLTLVSENNNGIHSKDDLQVKNLTLYVKCMDNALKGNDSVEISDANTTLISCAGDGIKTSNSDISSKGNQRGTISISGGTHTIYAACDGIDAAYNVLIDDSTTVLNIYTDKYSNYSTEVTDVSSANYYIRFTSNTYSYSVKYYNSDDDYQWVNAEYYSTVSSGMSNYYYYSFSKMTNYSKMKFFIYSSGMQQGQEEEYLVASDYLTPNSSYDTFALSRRGNSLSYSWTNYNTTNNQGGFGGMNEGNTNKSDYSTKGIKADNEIIIYDGTINIKSYDDGIHANNDVTLENGATPLGNVTINGGNITIYSNDDGAHADGTLSIAAGTLNVSNSYEGIEGSYINISGGSVSVISSDDGINATSTTGTAINISGGTIYVYCNGDGIDSNSRTSYSGIVFSGGNVVIISTSSGNSAIDTEQGYKYTGGSIVAIMPRGGMLSEATHCQNFSSVGTTKTSSLTKDAYLVVGIGSTTVTLKMPCTISAAVVILGNNSATLTTQASSSGTFDSNSVCWQ